MYSVGSTVLASLMALSTNCFTSQGFQGVLLMRTNVFQIETVRTRGIRLQALFDHIRIVHRDYGFFTRITAAWANTIDRPCAAVDTVSMAWLAFTVVIVFVFKALLNTERPIADMFASIAFPIARTMAAISALFMAVFTG